MASNDYDQFKNEDINKRLESLDINGSKCDDDEDDDEEAEDFDEFMQANMNDEVSFITHIFISTFIPVAEHNFYRNEI